MTSRKFAHFVVAAGAAAMFLASADLSFARGGGHDEVGKLTRGHCASHHLGARSLICLASLSGAKTKSAAVRVGATFQLSRAV